VSFIHLHIHSVFSLMRGTADLDTICRTVKELGMDRFALTDTNNLYGHVFFLQAARRWNITPIIGAELRRNNRERAVVLAKTDAGYESLCRLVSLRHACPGQDLGSGLLANSREIIVLTDHLPLMERLQGEAEVYAELVRGKPFGPVLAFARSRGIPIAATGGVHFIAPEDFGLHKLARAIDLNTTLSRVRPSDCAPRSAYLSGPEEMEASFPNLPEAVDNTRRISDACLFSGRPRHIVTPGFRGLDRRGIMDMLRAKAEAGIAWRYRTETPAVRRRLEYELDLISQKGFGSVFLVVADIVKQAPITCGRGSAAASIVSYLLGITNVDPLGYNLYFERFLNPGRTDPPDIDIDFPWDQRDHVLDYIFDTYGRDRTAMIANHVGFRPRAAVREIAKVYGFPDADIKQITDRLAHIWHWTGASVEETIRSHPVFSGMNLDTRWAQVIGLSPFLSSMVRHISVHCGGVVITPRPVNCYVPVQAAPKGVQVIQWEKDQAEDAGLVKIDVLGNRSLAVIRDTIAAVRSIYGKIIDYQSFNPLHDPETQRCIAAGDTMGVFYIESPAMRQLQKKTGKGDFEHLVIHSSIIRPAANTYINEYIMRLRGKKTEPVHPVLDRVLKETYGIMVYQEDVTKIAVELAGFTPAMGDGLRKTLSKKHNSRKLTEYRQRFVSGAAARGVSRPVIDSVWQMILSFGGYSFCKPHSASYAMVSFKSAFLRAHYPAEFMAAVISNRGGYYSCFAYLSEARRMGLDILPPDINQSERHFTGAHRQIRVGFMQIKGLRDRTIDTLLRDRTANGPFASMEQFIRRVDPDPADLALLIRIGCFDVLEQRRTRPQLLWVAKTRRKRPGPAVQASLGLFDSEPAVTPDLDEYGLRTRILTEVELLGFPLSMHPLDLYAAALDTVSYINAADMEQYVGKNITITGWWITNKLVYTKEQEPMAFISFEDKTALYETVFFPRAFKKYARLFSPVYPFVLSGRVEQEFGAVYLNVSHVRTIRKKPDPRCTAGMLHRHQA